MNVKKIGLPIVGAIIVIAVSAYVYISKHRPNDDDKAYHRSSLCYVISKPRISQNPIQMYDNFLYVAQNAIPDYAYYKPKIYEEFAHKLINRFYSFSPEEQERLRKDTKACDKALDQD